MVSPGRALSIARGLVPVPRTLRVGVTGLARAGKTALLTSIGANLLAAGGGFPALPALAQRLAGRSFRVAVAPSGADPMPRFYVRAHAASLAEDPPRWPERTQAVSLLALDLDIGWPGALALWPPARVQVQLLDYPGEWLVDLPLLRQDFGPWSAQTLARLAPYPQAAAFVGFVRGIPARAAGDEGLVQAGYELYRQTLHRLREEVGLSLLQPGRLLMPPPGPPPPWLALFPYEGDGGLAELLRDRYGAYQAAVKRELVAPGFGDLDRLVVLADMLSALHAGPAAFADAAEAMRAVSAALRWRGRFAWLAPLLPAFGGIDRVAYVASKADHVAARQRGNLAALVRAVADPPEGAAAFAVAAIRCTEDIVWALDGHPVSAVRGRVAGSGQAARSYPGEVPDRPPEPGFWEHRFLSLPDFEPVRLPQAGRAGVPNLDVDRLLTFLLEDFL